MSTYKLVPLEYRSDKRIKGGRIGKCVICDNLRQLSLSHIIPKWINQPLIAEGGIFNHFDSLNMRPFKDQDGAKQYLLCSECENFMSVSENYIKTFMLGSDESKTRLGIEVKNHRIYDLNFELISRYLLGTAIRIHFATCVPYHEFSLNYKDLSIIKAELLSPKNDDLKFICIASKFHPNIEPKIESTGIIHVELQYFKKKNIPYLTILGCGWEWLLIVDCDYKFKFDNFYVTHRIRTNSPYELLEGNILDHRYVEYVMKLNNELD